MKKLKVILLIIPFLMSACNKEEGEDVNMKVEDNYNFYTSNSMYNEAQHLRSDEYSDLFEIESVERKDNDLYVTISYNDNCDQNEFNVIWNGTVMESYPYQIGLIITREAGNCSAEDEIVTETLVIDLAELIGDEVLVNETLFHVANGSKLPGEENADIEVTINE